jgi:hypothetical protein
MYTNDSHFKHVIEYICSVGPLPAEYFQPSNKDSTS